MALMQLPGKGVWRGKGAIGSRTCSQETAAPLLSGLEFSKTFGWLVAAIPAGGHALGQDLSLERQNNLQALFKYP